MFDEDMKALENANKLLKEYIINKIEEFLKKSKEEVLENLDGIMFKRDILIDNITIQIMKDGYVAKVQCGCWGREVDLFLEKHPVIERLIKNLSYATDYFAYKNRVADIKKIIGGK